jgi:hypothetical protein
MAKPVINVGGVAVHGSQHPTRIVIHATDGEGDPANLPNDKYWKENGYGSTLAIDASGRTIRFTPDTQISYSTGGANTGTLSIEIVGLASWSANQWNARPAQLEAVARAVAGWSTAYKIPITVDTEHGVSTHAMQSKLHPESGGHTDPGNGFPFSKLLDRARTIAKQSGQDAANWVRSGEASSGSSGGGGEQWSHPGVVRGVMEAFYDPIGSWDLQSNPTAPWGGAIGGHSTHVHISDEDPESMIYLINVAQRMGLSVSENPYTDPNMDGDHVGDSYHYRTFEGLYNGKKLGMGIDVGSQYGTPAQMAAFYRYVTKKGQGNNLPGKIPEIKYSNGASRSRWSSEPMPTTDRIQAPFLEMVLRGMKAPVTESNMRFLAGWSGLENTAATNNPLASTRQTDGSTDLAGNAARNNGIAVQNYPDPETGVKMTIAHLLDYKAITRLLRTGDAYGRLHGNKAVYAELNLWGGRGAGKPYATSYTNAVEDVMKRIDPYANPRGITDGDYPNMATPENTPSQSEPPPTDANDRIYPEIDQGLITGETSNVPGWTPNLIRPGMLYDRSYEDLAHSNMLADTWAQIASDENASKEARRFASMYGA